MRLNGHDQDGLTGCIYFYSQNEPLKKKRKHVFLMELSDKVQGPLRKREARLKFGPGK